MLSMIKVLGAVALLATSSAVTSDVPSVPTDPAILARVVTNCMGWREDILNFAMTALSTSIPGETPPPPSSFPIESVRLVSVSANGRCNVLQSDGNLRAVPVISEVQLQITDELYASHDASGIYFLIEFKPRNKEERIFGGLVLDLPQPEQELRGIGRIHTLD